MKSTASSKRLNAAVKALHEAHRVETEKLIPQLVALAPNLNPDKLREHAKVIGLNSLYDLRNALRRSNELIASLS